MALAPMTPFVDYAPNPQGPGYMFQHSNGNRYLSYGPAADQLKAQIDVAKRQQQAQQLALNGNGMNAADAQASFDAGAPNVATPDTGPAPIMAPPPPPAPAPAPQAPEPQRIGTTTVEHVEPKEPAQAEPSNEPPGKVLPPNGNFNPWKGPTPTGEAQGQPAAPPIPQRGFVYTPGRNPAAEAKNAVAVPTAQTVVTEGGIQDPERRQTFLDTAHAQIEAEKNLAKVQENAATTQLENERANLLEAQKRQQDAEEAIAAQQARQALIRKEYDNRMAIAEQDYDVASKKEVDQYRLFKGSAGATTAGILATIGAAMGAAATAYRPGMQNYALQILNRTIDNDVEAQRDEIHRGVAKSSNDIKRISDQYNMDYDDAASVLKMNYLRRADAELAKKAAMNGTQQAQLAYAQAQPVLQKRIADIQADMGAKLDGQIKTVQESKMVQPSRGGVSLESDKAYSERLKREAENEANRYKIQHGGAAPPKAGTAGPGKLPARMAMTEAINESSQHDINNLAELDPKGNFILSEETQKKVPQFLKNDKYLQYEAAVTAAIPKILAANGETQTEGAMQAWHQKLMSPDPRTRKFAQDEAKKAAQVVHKAIERQRGQVQGAAGGEPVDENGEAP